MTVPYFAPPVQVAAGVPKLRSTARFRVQYRRGLTALTGQAATLARASAATLVDSAGATVTVPHSLYRPESRVFLGAPAIGCRVTADDLTYPLEFFPEDATVLVEGINLGTANASGAGLLYLGRDDGSGNRYVIRGTGTTFAVDLVSGANTSTSTFPAAIANGDAFQLVAQLEDAGGNMRVRIGGSLNGVDVGWGAWGTAYGRAAAWGAGAKLRVNRVGSAGTIGSAWIRQIAWTTRSTLTLADCLGRL